MKKIIAFSGTHGTGKTTSAEEYKKKYKMNYPKISAKVMADLENECPFDKNQAGTRETQAWIFANQILEELKYINIFDLVVCDRTIIDVVGYTQALGFDALAAAQFDWARYHIQAYSEIYFRKIANNPFHYDDGIRDMDPDFRQKVEDNILTCYDSIIASGSFPGKIYFN